MGKLISKIQEEEELEQRYDKIMRTAANIIETRGLADVFWGSMRVILKQNAKKGYTRHVSFNINKSAALSGVKRETLVDQFQELEQYVWSSPEGDILLSWGEFELNGDIATVVIDSKFLEVFMRQVAQDTLRDEFKEKVNV